MALKYFLLSPRISSIYPRRVEYRILFLGGGGGGGGRRKNNFDMAHFHAMHALLGGLGACSPRKTRCSETEF